MKLQNKKQKSQKVLIIAAIVLAVALLIGGVVWVVSLISNNRNNQNNGDPNRIVKISLMSEPKREYTVGELFDPTNVRVQVITEDPNNSYTIDYTKCEFSGFDSSEVAESQTITITYKGVQTTYIISIKEESTVPAIEKIEVQDMFVEYSVYEWQNWGPSELNAWILITYSDGTTRGSLEETPLQRSSITGWDPEYNYSAGKTQVTVSYTENGVTYTTTVEITLN